MIQFFHILNNKEKILLSLLVIGMLISSLLEIIGLSIIIPIVYSLSDNNFFDSFNQFSFLKNYIPFQTKQDTLLFFLTFFCIVFFIKNLYLILFHYFEGRFIFGLVKEISTKLYKHYVFQEYYKIIKDNSSKLITKLINELNFVQTFLISSLTLLSESIIFIIIIIFLITLYSFKIIYILTFFILLISIFFFFFYKKIKSLGEKRKTFEILRSKKINETTGGIKDIKILGLEDLFFSKYYNYADSISKFFYKYYTIQKVPRLYLETSVIICLSLLTYYLFKEKNNPSEVFTILAINFAIVIRLLPSINKLINAYNTNKFSRSSALEILRVTSKNVIYKKKLKSNFENKIKFHNINFSHNKNNVIFKNLNFAINKGEKIALVGRSGIGKSTFIDLTSGLIKPTKGEITIDNKIISDKKLSNLVSYVPQSTYLFDDTLFYNVTLDDIRTVSKNNKFLEILKICDLYKFHNSNTTKNKKYKLGDKGVKISGGQKQRVGIARALYNLKEILLLDEPTSSLEASLEKKIIKNILKAYKNKTIIIITHKTVVAKKFDKIFTLQNKTLKKLKIK
jgi:ABC-type bacteriocin/lantibiotic exporter with double-glycine peptidase domain